MRKLAMAAFSFAAGIFLSQYLFSRISLQLFFAAAAGICGAAAILFKKVRPALVLCALGVGFLYHAAFCHFLLSPAEMLDGQVKTVEMEVADYPEETAYGVKVPVRLQSENLFLSKAIYFGAEDLILLRPGNTVLTQVELDFTQETSCAQKGVFLLLYDRGEVAVEKGNKGSLRYLPQRINHGICNKVNKLYSDDVSGFMKSILVGDTAELSASHRADLTEAGLWHITAVSGLHCSFLIALLGLFTGRAGYKRKAFLGIPLLALYALTVGASPSVVRAAVMIGFVLLAPLFGKENDPLTALSAALLLILMCNPFSAKGASLQLSFAAVLGLLLLSPRLQAALTVRGGRVRRFLAGNLSATLGALVFTVPLSAVYFNTFTLLTPVSNLFCLGAVSAAFSLGILSVGFSFIFLPLGRVLAWVAELLARYVLLVAGAVAKVPYHAVYFTDERMKWWLIYAYALFALCFLAKRKTRRRVITASGLAFCSLALCLAVMRKEAVASSLDVTVLDVGQGQCVLLTSGEECVVVDCGSENPAVDAGALAAEELFRRGYYAPKKLILTHPDADHTNGVVTLCARMDVEEIWCPAIEKNFGGGEALFAAAENCPVSLTAGNTLAFGEAELRVFAPFSGMGGNDGGLAVLCSAGDFDVLITGDMSEKGEAALTELLPEREIEVLLAGHHGADDACSEELLQWSKARAVVISVGENHYGHPGFEMQMRAMEAGCALYRTDRMGNMSIRAN